MNAYHLFLIILFTYISFLVLTGIYFNKKQQSQTDFRLAGKSAGFLSIGVSAWTGFICTG
jgi:SSS family solute:Na+ symporter